MIELLDSKSVKRKTFPEIDPDFALLYRQPTAIDNLGEPFDRAEAVRHRLGMIVGWEGVTQANGDGQPAKVPFSVDRLAELLGQQPRLQAAVYEWVMRERGHLLEEEEKNLSGSPLSPSAAPPASSPGS